MSQLFKRDRGEPVFTQIGPNSVVPMQPWPQKFYVSRSEIMRDRVEVRPLTVTGLIKGVGQNFVSMNFWRLCFILRALGFLSTKECCLYHWRDLTLRVWKYHQLRRFRWARWIFNTYMAWRNERETRAWLSR